MWCLKMMEDMVSTFVVSVLAYGFMQLSEYVCLVKTVDFRNDYQIGHVVM